MWELSTGIETTRYVLCVILSRSYLHFCEKMITLLQKYDIKPILVFDGESLPAKQHEDEERRAFGFSSTVTCRRRTKKYEEGKALMAQGKRKEAYQMFTQSLIVSSEMIKQFLLLLIRMRIPYIIAPYEADAEIAFFSRTGIVDAVISEDSDTLCYGCPCTLFKLSDNGCCKCVHLVDIFTNPTIHMTNWNCDLFELMCVLSGCDYLPNLPKVGLKTAKKYIDNGKTIEGTLKLIRVNPIHKWTTEYGKQLKDTLCCFHHQVIFNPLSNELEYLTPFASHEEPCSQDGLFGSIHSTEGMFGYFGVNMVPKDTDLSYITSFFTSRKLAVVPSICKIIPKRDNLHSTPKKTMSFAQQESGSNKRDSDMLGWNSKRQCSCSPTSVVPNDWCDSLQEEFDDGFVKELERIESQTSLVFSQTRSSFQLPDFVSFPTQQQCIFIPP